jgi:integrase
LKNPSLKNAIQKYLKTVSILKKGYEQERYRVAQISASFLGEMRVQSIESFHIAEYRDMRLQQTNPKTGNTISPSTVRLELSLLSNFFDIARIEWGLVKENPVKLVRKPKPAPGRVRRLSPREEKLIMRYCHNFTNPELFAIVTLAIETAMRQGEILALRWEHIDLTKRIAHLPDTKNGSSRDVPLTNTAKETLISLGVSNYGPVFQYTARGLKSAWRVMIKSLNIEDLKFHDLRHEAVSRLTEMSTLDMMEVAAISGHKSMAMLKRYTHLKAHKLVKKLDGNRNKSKQIVLNHLVPYPAIVQSSENGVSVVLPDFDGLQIEAPCKELSMHLASGVLLKEIIKRMRDGKKIPVPDHYLEEHEGQVIMIDPLENDRIFDKVLAFRC